MIKQQLFIGAALLAGVAIGYFVGPQASSSPKPEAKEVAAPKGAIPEAKDAGRVAALRARIRELESKLAGQSETPIKEASERRENQVPKKGDSVVFNSRSRKEWIENMKKNNPNGYTAMTNAIANANRERLERHQKKLDFFSSIDTSGMSASFKATHAKLQDLIIQRETMDQGRDWESMTTEEMGEYHEKRRAIENEIANLSEVERKNLITETAKELGFQGENAANFAATIQEIYDATETPGWWRRRQDGHHGGRGGRGPGPR